MRPMTRLRGGRLAALLLAVGLASCSSSTAPQPSSATTAPSTAGPSLAPTAGPSLVLPRSPLTSDQRILHVLNRLGYGPRPGDLERVRQMGLAAYIQQQLDPASIPDPAADRALRGYRTLELPTVTLVREYPRPTPEVRQKLQSGEMAPSAMREVYPPERRPFRITTEMQAAKVTRAVLSERQLQEV